LDDGNRLSLFVDGKEFKGKREPNRDRPGFQGVPRQPGAECTVFPLTEAIERLHHILYFVSVSCFQTVYASSRDSRGFVMHQGIVRKAKPACPYPLLDRGR